MNEQTLCAAFYPDSDLQDWHSGRYQSSQNVSEQLPFKKYLHGSQLNFPDWLLPLAFLLLDALLPRVLGVGGSEAAWLLVSVLNDRYSHADNYIGLPLNTALLLSTGYKYLFLFQCHFITCDSSNTCKSFWSLLLFTIIFNLWELGIDIFWWTSMSYNSKTTLSWSDSRILNLYRLSRISFDGIFVKDSKISSHLVSNSWTLSLRREVENESAKSRTVSWAPMTHKIVVDHENDRSSFWAFCSSRLTFYLKCLIQKRSSLRVQHFESREITACNCSRRFSFIHGIDHLHFWDP